jgi:acyl-coenzyme A thioesterase PaaI-like protein
MLLRRGLRHAIRRPAAPRVQRSASSQRNATTTALPAALGLLGLGGASAWCLSIEDWSKRVDDPALEATFEGWTRADAAIVKDGLAANSAIYDALGARTEGLRQYKIFAKKDGSAVSAIATFGDCCVGHPGVVHGGVTSLLFDNTLGWANAYSVLGERGALDAARDPVEAAALRKSSTKLFGYTANLHVNYRKPVFVGTTVVIECALDRVEGRKRFLQGKMTCAKTGAHLADATALFVLPRS